MPLIMIILFHLLQAVRELGQFFYYPIPSSSISRAYVNLDNCLNIPPPDHPISFLFSVSRKYVNLINHLKTSHLIIPSLPLQFVRELNQSFEDLSFNHPIPSSIPRAYVNLVNCLNTSHQIIRFIPSHSVHPFPDRT
jgi:hypothetical protein